MRTSDAINELIMALVAARKKFAPVVRNAKGQVGQNREYKYADLEGLIGATMPALLEQGIVVMQAVDAESQTLITRLMHVSGQWTESAYPLGRYERPQEFGSQLSYARRYSLYAMLWVAQEDDDGAEAQRAHREPEPDRFPAPPPQRVGYISQDQVKRLWTIGQKHGWTKDHIKAWLIVCGYASSKDIKLEAYDDIIATLSASPDMDYATTLARSIELQAARAEAQETH